MAPCPRPTTRIDPARLAGTVVLVRLAHVAAFEHRVPYVNPFDRRNLNRQAVADGRPTVLIEIGENGRRDAAFVDPIVKGVNNVLRVLTMMPGAPDPPRADVRWFDGTADPMATVTGIYTPVATTGRMVEW